MTHITENITHEIDLAELLDGHSLDVDFTVDITERDGVDEGDVEIRLRYMHAFGVELDCMLARFRKSILAEINRLKDADELVEAARAQTMIAEDSKGGRDE